MWQLVIKINPLVQYDVGKKDKLHLSCMKKNIEIHKYKLKIEN